MTPSVPARAASLVAKVVIRRRNWGRTEGAMKRRARRLFGVPAPLRGLWSYGVRISPISRDGVRGELIVPSGASGKTLVYLHGGGYVACSPATHRPITTSLARLAHRTVYSLDYRLAPEHRFPAAIDDALAGYRWVLARGVDPASLAVAGDSAGGGLVLALLLRLRDLGLPLPTCAVCFSPWTDLTGSGDSIHTNDGRCAVFRPENIAVAATAYLDGESPRNPYASPFFGDLSGLPPLLFQASSTELLLDDSRRVHEKVEATGGKSRLEVYEDLCHVWQMLEGIVPEARVALRQAATFMNELAHLPLLLSEG